MKDTIINVENISKEYRLGSIGYGTLRYDLQSWWAKFRGQSDPNKPINYQNTNDKNDFWALNNVSFEIERGDIVGIIGRNGAGKSTLLKILSRITSPTTGQITLKGRVSSLLEIGTGFHPDLSGRENIYLNGTILGMKKREIDKKLDEIVNFAEIEKFIDTPVKRYSSGMYVRLAFAVAAHLEPEILIVDEVLAVGDAKFQNKCLGMMKEVSANQGRTVLFVSHNMDAIRRLCKRIILLDAGSIAQTSSIEDAITQYKSGSRHLSTNAIKFPIKKDVLILHNFNVRQANVNGNDYNGDNLISIMIDYELTRDTSDFRIGFFIKSSLENLVAKSFLADWQSEYANQKKGLYKINATIPANFLPQGTYTIELKAGIQALSDYGIESTVFHVFNIFNPMDYNNAYPNERFEGAVLLNPNWKLSYDSK